jgi:hypothetical protein
VPSRRTLASGIHALRSLDAGSLSASCLRSPATPARLARAHPSRTRIPSALTNRSPPARAGGTAGRWAIPVPGNPQPVHHQPSPIRVHHRRGSGRTRIPFALTNRSPPARAGGTAGRWAIPVPGSPKTLHHQPSSIRGHHRRGSGRACAISPDARCGHPCPPLARCWLALGILPSLASNAGSIGTGPPLANPDSVRPWVGKGYRHLASLGASPLFAPHPSA